MDSSSSPKSLASPKTVASSSLDVEAQPEDYSCDAEEGSPPSASGATRSRRAEPGTLSSRTLFIPPLCCCGKQHASHAANHRVPWLTRTNLPCRPPVQVQCASGAARSSRRLCFATSPTKCALGAAGGAIGSRCCVT